MWAHRQLLSCESVLLPLMIHSLPYSAHENYNPLPCNTTLPVPLQTLSRFCLHSSFFTFSISLVKPQTHTHTDTHVCAVCTWRQWRTLGRVPCLVIYSQCLLGGPVLLLCCSTQSIVLNTYVSLLLTQHTLNVFVIVPILFLICCHSLPLCVCVVAVGVQDRHIHSYHVHH